MDARNTAVTASVCLLHCHHLRKGSGWGQHSGHGWGWDSYGGTEKDYENGVGMGTTIFIMSCLQTKLIIQKKTTTEEEAANTKKNIIASRRIMQQRVTRASLDTLHCAQKNEGDKTYGNDTVLHNSKLPDSNGTSDIVKSTG